MLMFQLPQIESLFHIMTSVLRMPGIQNHRMVLDPIAKLVSYGIQNCTTLKFTQLISVCHYCNRSFSRERDKQLITRYNHFIDYIMLFDSIIFTSILFSHTYVGLLFMSWCKR
jgi:hypothetical protein